MNKTRILDREYFVKLDVEGQIKYLQALVFTSGSMAQYARMAGHAVPFTNTPDDFASKIRYSKLNPLHAFDAETSVLTASFNALKSSMAGVWPYERNVKLLMDLFAGGKLAR